VWVYVCACVCVRVCVCLCVRVRVYSCLICPACKSLAKYYILCGLSESATFFPHYLTNGTIFMIKILNIKCVFWFSVQLFFSKISHSKDKCAGYYHKCTVHRSSCTVPLFLMIVFFFTNLMHKFFILIHLLYSSTCFEHYYAHLQEDNCIITASDVVNLFRWLFSTQVVIVLT